LHSRQEPFGQIVPEDETFQKKQDGAVKILLKP
jgi:hypothetical protein